MELWGIVNPDDATAFTRMIPDDYPDLLIQFLPYRTLNSNKSRRAKFSRTNVTATYRAWNTETPIGQRPDVVEVTEYKLPPIGQKLVVTEWEALQLQLQIANGSPAALAAIVEQIYDDIEHNVRAIRNRLSLARGDLLTDGKFTLNAENGLTLEADWGVPNTHIFTVGTLWSDHTNSTPLTDELNWNQNLLVADSGEVEAALVMPLAIANHLRMNAEYKQSVYPGTSPPNLTIDQVNLVRTQNGLPPITIYDKRLVVDGVTTRVTPSDRVIGFIANVGETQMGITAESLELVGSNASDLTIADAPGLISAVYKIPDPVTGITKTSGVGMPVLADPNGLVSVKVI